MFSWPPRNQASSRLKSSASPAVCIWPDADSLSAKKCGLPDFRRRRVFLASTDHKSLPASLSQQGEGKPLLLQKRRRQDNEACFLSHFKRHVSRSSRTESIRRPWKNFPCPSSGKETVQNHRFSFFTLGYQKIGTYILD